MMRDVWSQVGIICGALIALFTLLGLVWTKAVRPMFRGTKRFVRRMNQVADDLLGDQARGIPSMIDRQVRTEKAVAELDRKLNEHILAHDATHPGLRVAPSAPAVVPRPGQPGQRRR